MTENDNRLGSRIKKQFNFMKGNYLTLVSSWFITDFSNEIAATYYPLFVKNLGGSASIIGLLGFIDMITMAIVQVPGGYISDRYGRKPLIITMTFLTAFTQLFYIFAQNWYWLLIGSLLGGLTRLYLPAIEAIFADSLPSERRGIGFSVLRLITQVSTTPSPIIAGILFTVFGLNRTMRIAYTFVLVAYVSAGLLRLRLVETIENPEKMDAKEMISSLPDSIKESITVWGKVPRSALYLLITQMITWFSFSLYQPIYSLFIIEDLGISELHYSYVISATSLTLIIMAIPIGMMVDKIGKVRPLIAAYILWAVGIPLFLLGGFYHVFISLVVFGIVQLTISTASSALYTDLIPADQRGKTIGSSGFLTFLIMAMGQLIGGYVYDEINHMMPFYLMLSLTLPCFLFFIFKIKESDKES